MLSGMNVFSYVIVRDFGFAPNPFGNYCTLATCKPLIRENASTGDWVIGTCSSKYGAIDKLIYAMKVDEKIDFNQYWNDERFQKKKPVLNGSLKQMYGDNIYHFDSSKNVWIQANSHHSCSDGSPNKKTMDRDLESKFVLVSRYFWYFGKNAVLLPREFVAICKKGRGYKRKFSSEFIKGFLQWLHESYSRGYKGDPHQFNSFVRYSGV